MSNDFNSSWNSIEHAKRRLHEFEAEMSAFFNSKPYARVVETNESRTEDTHKLKLTKPVPVELLDTAFDAFNSLRSALDKAAHTIAVAAGANGSQARFPFGDSLAEVKSRAQSGSTDIPKEVFDLLVSFQPYRGGNDLLWGLNEICNSNKYTVIVPVAIVTSELSGHDISGADTIRASWPPLWDGTKEEMVIAVMRHGAAFHGNFEFKFHFALGNIELIGGEPVATVIERLIGKAQSIVSAMQAEAARIGIIK